MGFWDFIAPDFEAFREATIDVVPDYVAIPPVILSDEDLVSLAWLTPGSGAGLALRLYYEAQQLGAAGPAVQQLVNSAIQQGTAGGFGSGAGFGGSFGWQSGDNMPVLVIPNVYRVAVEAISGGQAVTNVVGVRGSSSGLAQQATAAVQTAWKIANGPLAGLAASYALTGFRGLDLSSVNGGIAYIADGSTGGTTTSTKSTNAACALVKWNGGTRSRSSRGRLYYGPLREAQIAADGRSLEAGVAATITTAFTAFRNSLSSSGFTLCVISPTTASAFDVSAVTVESIIATQRRRIRG